MDGIARPGGGGTSINFNGETILIQPFTLRDFATLENHLLLKKRLEHVKIAASVFADIPRDEAVKMLREARQEAEAIKDIPTEEVMAWMDTAEGIAFTLFQIFDRSNKGKYKLDQIEEIVSGMMDVELEKLMASRDQAATTDMAGNSTSPI